VAFRDYVVAQQKKAATPDAIRVTLQTLQVKAPVQGDGSNPAIPVIVAAAGVFLAFIALIFIIHGARSSSRQKRAQRASGARRGRGEAGESADDDVEAINDVPADEDADGRTRVPAGE
jgi:hypothetical protein